MRKLLTVKQLAEVLSVAIKTLYQWVELRQIPCLKLNGTVRFDEVEIEQWIASCKKTVISDYNALSKLEARKGGQSK